MNGEAKGRRSRFRKNFKIFPPGQGVPEEKPVFQLLQGGNRSAFSNMDNFLPMAKRDPLGGESVSERAGPCAILGARY